MKKFRITYELDVVLTQAEIWPDGDGPSEPTVENLVGKITRSGGFRKVFTDWNLDLNPQFRVEEVEEK